MKYLMCAFRNNILLKTAKLDRELEGNFRFDCANSVGVEVDSIKVVKFNLDKYEYMCQFSELTVKISKDAIKLVRFEDEMKEIASAVDKMTASEEELSEFYDEDEIAKIHENREWYATLTEEELRNGALYNIPHRVAIRVKTEMKRVKEEILISSIAPEV